MPKRSEALANKRKRTVERLVMSFGMEGECSYPKTIAHLFSREQRESADRAIAEGPWSSRRLTRYLHTAVEYAETCGTYQVLSASGRMIKGSLTNPFVLHLPYRDTKGKTSARTTCGATGASPTRRNHTGATKRALNGERSQPLSLSISLASGRQQMTAPLPAHRSSVPHRCHP